MMAEKESDLTNNGEFSGLAEIGYKPTDFDVDPTELTPEEYHKSIDRKMATEAELELAENHNAEELARAQELGLGFDQKTVNLDNNLDAIKNHIARLARSGERHVPVARATDELQAIIISLYPTPEDRALLISYFHKELEEVFAELGTPKMERIQNSSHKESYPEYRELADKRDRVQATIGFLTALESHLAKVDQEAINKEAKALDQFDTREHRFMFGNQMYSRTPRTALSMMASEIRRLENEANNSPTKAQEKAQLASYYRYELSRSLDDIEPEELLAILAKNNRPTESQELALLL